MEIKLIVVVTLALLMIAGVQASSKNYQIHSHFGSDASIRVFTFVTSVDDNASCTSVQYGTDSNNLTLSASGSSFTFGTQGHNFVIHNVEVKNLQLNEQYSYRVGCDNTNDWSEVYSFRTYGNQPLVYAVYGDFGISNDVSLSQLTEEVDNNMFDAVIHAGDFAYDLDSDQGQVGDEFMEAIEPIAARVPYMTCPGNHENGYNFSHYINRFSGVTQAVGQPSQSETNLWYSFNVDNIHWIAIDTEVYAYFRDEEQISRQLAWLESDLIAANQNRDQVPWIIMFGHKLDYMDKVNFTGFGDLAHKYGVDLYLCGHQHNYQRFYPYFKDSIDVPSNKNMYIDPKYMSSIVVGSPGCKEQLTDGQGPSDKTAYFSISYGYGHLTVFNSTHLYWHWERTGTQNNVADADWKDDMWIVQHNHGPRV